MKRISITLLILVTGFFSHAQTDPLTAADSISLRARDLSIARQYDSAIVYYQRSAAAYLQEGNLKDHYLNRISVAFQMNYQGKPDEAIALIETVIEEVNKKSSLSPEVLNGILFEAYRVIAVVNDVRGQLNEAIKFYTLAQEKMSDSTSIEGMKQLAGLSNSWGITYAKSGVYRKAKAKLEVALKLYRKAKVQSVRVASVMNNLGNLADLTGIPNEALRYYHEALDYNAELLGSTDNPRFGTLYKNMGDIYARIGLLDQALEHYKKAYALLKKAGNSNAYAFMSETLIAMGNTYEKLEAFEKSAELKDEALSINLQIFGENHPSTADAVMGLGGLYLETEQNKKAIKAYDRANTILQKLYKTDSQQFIAINFITKGRAMVKDGQEESGFKSMDYGSGLLRDIFKDNGQQVAEYLHLTGRTYKESDRLDESLAYYQQSLIANSTEFKSKNVYDNPSLQTINSAKNIVRVLIDKAFAFESKYDLTDSIHYLRAAHDAVNAAMEFSPELLKNPTLLRDKIRFSNIIQSLNEVGIRTNYALLQHTGEKQYLDQAFLLSEQGKSNLILSSINQTIMSTQTGISQKFITEEENFENNMSYLESQIFQLEQAGDNADPELKQFYEDELFKTRNLYNDFLLKLKKEHPLYYNVKFDNDRIDLASVQKELINKNQLLLSYFADDDYLFLFQITQTDVKFDRITMSAEFLESLAKFREFLNKPPGKSGSIKDFMAYNKVVSETLLKGVEGIDSFDEIMIIPDGYLSLVPFELLMKNNQDNSNAPWYSNTLFSTHTISYANSATVGLFLKEKAPVDHQKFALALAPAFSTNDTKPASGERDNLGPLIWTGPEVENVKKYFDTDILIGDEATERKFRENIDQYALIHIASHAVLNELNTFFSKLVMSNTQTDSISDGNITTREIFSLSIPADLVVLSACNTGVGQVMGGEGVISLANSFFFAGSKSLVMTLWTANDESTAVIMDHFYKNLSEGQTKSEALRNAKLSYLVEVDNLRSHPYYWAHFVVNGDDRPLITSSLPKAWWLLLLIPVAIILMVRSRKKSAT